MSYDHESRHCAASFRSSPHYAKQSHNVRTIARTTHTHASIHQHLLTCGLGSAHRYLPLRRVPSRKSCGPCTPLLHRHYSPEAPSFRLSMVRVHHASCDPSPPFPSLLFYSQPPLTLFHRDGRCMQHRQAMTWPSADGSCWPLALRPPTRYLLKQFFNHTKPSRSCMSRI